VRIIMAGSFDGNIVRETCVVSRIVNCQIDVHYVVRIWTGFMWLQDRDPSGLSVSCVMILRVTEKAAVCYVVDLSALRDLFG